MEVLPFTHSLIEKVVSPGNLVVDATMGNGHDTLFLARLVGPSGTVLAYDVQDQALESTRKRLQHADCLEQVRLLHKGHETVADELKLENKPLSAAMFNLGYLPGSDKKVITKPDTTLAALDKLKTYLRPGGLITVVVYSGHQGGKEEEEALLAHLRLWDQSEYQVIQYRFINRAHHSPYLIAIKKA